VSQRGSLQEELAEGNLKGEGKPSGEKDCSPRENRTSCEGAFNVNPLNQRTRQGKKIEESRAVNYLSTGGGRKGSEI